MAEEVSGLISFGTDELKSGTGLLPSRTARHTYSTRSFASILDVNEKFCIFGGSVYWADWALRGNKCSAYLFPFTAAKRLRNSHPKEIIPIFFEEATKMLRNPAMESERYLGESALGSQQLFHSCIVRVKVFLAINLSCISCMCNFSR